MSPSSACELLRLRNRRSRCGSCSLGPNIMKDHRSNGDADQDAHDAVTDFVEISVGCVALEHAEKKSERDLKAGVTDSLTSGRDPRGNCADCGNEHNERRDSFHMRNKKYD